MRTGIGAFLFMVVSWSVMAQEYESFFEEYDVVLHQLQVNVLDKNDLPIKNLTKEDLEVYLNGKFQNLESLEEVDLEAQITQADTSGQAVSQAGRRLFVFLFDLRYSTRRGVLSSQEAARNFVMTDMLPSDLAGVFTYTQLSGISRVTNFTSDTNHLLSAIDTLGLSAAKNVLPGPSGYFLNGLVSDVGAIQGFNSFGNLTNATSSAQGQAGVFASEHLDEIMRLAQGSEKSNYEREVHGFLASMRKFGDGLRFIRGRKNLIWFSSGFDATSLVGTSSENLQKYGEWTAMGLLERTPSDQLGRGDIQSSALRAVEALQASGTVVFSVDTSRIDGMANDKSGMATLNFFSVDTGGRVFSNRNHYGEALNRIQDITNHYYVVSFYPQEQSKKAVGKVKIKLPNHPKSKVYTNKGLLLDPDFQKMTQIEKDIHIAEYIARDQLIRAIPLELNTLLVPIPREDLIKLTAAVEIRGDYFTTGQEPSKNRELEVFSIAFEQETDRVFDQSYTKFKVNPTELASVLDKTGVKYFSNLFVKPGNYKLKVVVRDLENGKIGSYIRNVNVADGARSLAGPIVLSSQRWVVIQQPEAAARRSLWDRLDISHPFQLGKETLTPASHQVLSPQGNVKLFYMLNYRKHGDNRTLPVVQALFMDENGEYILIPPEAVRAEMELKDNMPHLTHLVITLDMNQISLQEGSTYKLYTNFTLENRPAIRSISEFTVATL